MDQFVSSLVAVLSAGSLIVAKETATVTVKDAYAGLKNLIKRKYPGVDLKPLEENPTAVVQDLEREGASEDAQLITAAQLLEDRIQQSEFKAERSIGVSLGVLDQTDTEFGNVQVSSNAIGVEVDKTIGGKLSFKDVIAGSEPNRPKNA